MVSVTLKAVCSGKCSLCGVEKPQLFPAEFEGGGWMNGDYCFVCLRRVLLKRLEAAAREKEKSS
jgi:hypothetical protein